MEHSEEAHGATSKENPHDKNSSNFWKELIKLILISLLIVVPFRLYVAQPFIVDGASMDPTFDTGDYLIVDELTYHFKTPERGSVLIFKYPKDPRKSFIKRVIGLPGDTVSISDGNVRITNEENPDGFQLEEPYVEIGKRENFTTSLDDGEFFVMGDNRQGSADSRIWGPVPEDNIVGRPIVRLWKMISIFPGDYSQRVEAE
jgi:signal peptidase I